MKNNSQTQTIYLVTFAHFKFKGYHSMYILDPAETKQVGALTNPIGLKVAGENNPQNKIFKKIT